MRESCRPRRPTSPTPAFGSRFAWGETLTRATPLILTGLALGGLAGPATLLFFTFVLGLCVGHDSLFFRHSKGLATTLVAKDRVLAHNPVGALQLADSYFQRVWGPERPPTPPRLPAEGRER